MMVMSSIAVKLEKAQSKQSILEASPIVQALGTSVN